MAMRKTFVTRFPSIMNRLRLAHENGVYFLFQGELMRIYCLEEVGDTIIADLMPIEFLSDIGKREAA
jgi:hypothetical protein